MVDEIEVQKRPMMRSELDLQLLTTDSVWGKAEINPELRRKISQAYGAYVQKRNDAGDLLYDEFGKPVMDLIVTEEGLWSLLGFYTRDMRLGNLDSISGEVFYCQYYLDLANDYLQAKMVQPFLICLSRVATVLELSQSKKGFLRRRMNTLSQEHINIDNEPKKASLFGKTKKEV